MQSDKISSLFLSGRFLRIERDGEEEEEEVQEEEEEILWREIAQGNFIRGVVSSTQFSLVVLC